MHAIDSSREAISKQNCFLLAGLIICKVGVTCVLYTAFLSTFRMIGRLFLFLLKVIAFLILKITTSVSGEVFSVLSDFSLSANHFANPTYWKGGQITVLTLQQCADYSFSYYGARCALYQVTGACSYYVTATCSQVDVYIYI